MTEQVPDEGERHLVAPGAPIHWHHVHYPEHRAVPEYPLHGPLPVVLVSLLAPAASASEIIDQRLVDGCAFELEVLKILGKRQFGDGELVLERAVCFSLISTSSRSSNDALRFVLAYRGRSPA